MSVRRAQAEIDGTEFSEWMAYDTIQPLPPYCDDWRAGMLASVFVSPHLKKGAKQPAPEDYIPKWKPASDEPKDTKVVEAKLRHYFKAREAFAKQQGG